MRVTLEQVCDRGTSSYALKDLELLEGEYPIYGASGFIKNINSYHQEKEYIAVIKDGAGIGRTMFLPAKSSVIGTLQYLIPKENINPKYLYYAVKSMHLEKYFTGATIPHIYFKDYKNETFNLPCKEEQERIVQIFDKIEFVLEDKYKQLKLLDDLIKSRFVELFGVPVSNSKNWLTEKMNDIAPAVNYSGDFEETVWLLNLDMVEAQTGRIIDYLYVSEEEVGNSTCTFDTSNILYSKLRPYLNKVVIPDRCGYATSEMIPLKPNPMKLERTYLAFMLRSDEFVNMINEKVAGAKMPRVSMGDFRRFDVPVPPMELQKEFTAFVKQIDKSKFSCLSFIRRMNLTDSIYNNYARK